jgi:hypothetical protein
MLALHADGAILQVPGQKHGYRNNVRADKLDGAEELWHGSYPVSLRMPR